MSRRGARVAAELALFAALFAALLGTWSIAIARYGGPDEPAHVIRAASVARGELLGDRDPTFPGGYRVVEVPLVVASGDPGCFRLVANRPATCAHASESTSDVRVATAAGAYPPLYYALVGLPARALGGTTAAHRLASLLWSVVILGLVYHRSRRLGPAAVGLCAALAPATWFLLAVVNPNGWEILLAALAWVGVARAWSTGMSPSSADLRWIAVPLALAVLVRPVALMAAISVTAVLLCHRHLRAALRRPGYWLPQVVALAGVLVWQSAAHLAFDDPHAAVATGRWRVLLDALGGLPRTTWEMVAALGWSEFAAPRAAQVLAGSAALLVAGWALWRGEGTDRRAIVVALCCLVLVPVAFETLFAARVGMIWQGRYSAATAVGPVAIGAVVLGRRAAPSPRMPPATVLRATVLAVAAAEVLTFAVVLQRYTFGIGGRSWWSTGGDGWTPAIDARILAAANLCLAAALARLAWNAAARPQHEAAAAPIA